MAGTSNAPTAALSAAPTQQSAAAPQLVSQAPTIPGPFSNWQGFMMPRQTPAQFASNLTAAANVIQHQPQQQQPQQHHIMQQATHQQAIQQPHSSGTFSGQFLSQSARYYSE